VNSAVTTRAGENRRKRVNSQSINQIGFSGNHNYQTARLKEKAAPKSINEEVGFLLRLLGEQGDGIRVRLRRQKALKLAVRSDIGKAYSAEEKARLYGEAKKRRSKAIYPALVLTLNCGLRDKRFASSSGVASILVRHTWPSGNRRPMRVVAGQFP
jgi:hypothetical protein